ncbi:Hint domain-containing protein [Falsiphaeobacter marinintestinus]|uniref:Hint domain-containing protein n=1 Tax=Falsiphaeobacter marinintestinus TaxID=1492905 RepID=UPI0011B842EA|nr:Hint domain-containing protein [Phaeobacter marinintestinus]
MGSGITLYNVTGADSTSSNDTLNADAGGSFTYNVDVSAGETVTLTGNWDDLSFGPSWDGEFGSDGSYSASGAPTWGTFSLDPASGAMSFSFTAADLAANGGNQTLDFTVSGTDSNGDIDTDTVNIVITCFAKGTPIAAPHGPVAVEKLQIGDLILTAAGDSRLVKWVGRQTVATRFAPAERLMPVRFAAGSLGAGLPHADLTVTADHAMLIDGVLCNASALVNGTTITRVPLTEMGDTFTVYHIETEAHEIILANGAPTETFIDNVSRRVFDNFAEYDALYGDTPEMTELPYPRAMSARQVPGRLRRMIQAA